MSLMTRIVLYHHHALYNPVDSGVWFLIMDASKHVRRHQPTSYATRALLLVLCALLAPSPTLAVTLSVIFRSLASSGAAASIDTKSARVA